MEKDELDRKMMKIKEVLMKMTSVKKTYHGDVK